MSKFQTPITINEAMQHINNNEYLLPAFQREFVWDSEQIERLFDSLMRMYPTNSMLFWKVKGDTKTRWKFYNFINSYIKDASDCTTSNKLFNTSNSNDFFAILDGQQRLTAIRIGIYGTYAYHEPRKSWAYSESSFPTRTMYLNLSKNGTEDDDCEYFFSFKRNTETNLEDFYIDSKNDIWFKVGSIIEYHNSGEEISDYFDNMSLNKEQRKIIKRLENMIFNDLSITYYEEDEQNPDKAVKIFTRINSGGSTLSFSDIVYSLMVSNWNKKDARTEIDNLINSVSQKGFDIDKSYIIKAFLYLFHRSVKTEINSFTKEFCEIIENNWDNIRDCILSLFDLLKSFGLTSFTLTSNNATLPILYYLYHSNKYYDFTNKTMYESDRKEIKQWLYIAILRKLFGGTSDSILQQTRKAFTYDISQKFIDNNFNFSSRLINNQITNLGQIDDEALDNLLLTQKDNCYAFPILSLLYPNLDYKNNNFHKDHIHAEVLYKNLDENLKQEYPFKIYNSILNLQMLDSNENESKSSSYLIDWVNKNCGDDINLKQQFLNNHLIPNIDLSLSNFDEFIRERRKILKNKLINILQ